MPTIILASQSPRRKELLGKMGLQFQVIPSAFDERLDHTRPVEEVAVELALGKARAVAKNNPEAVVIGADTIVCIGGRQLGKPADEQEARHMLMLLAGRKHVVATGLAVVRQKTGTVYTDVAKSYVLFRPHNQDAAEAYLASNDWRDKAGAYGLQSGATPLVTYIEGPYDSILGLSTHTLARILKNFGVKAHRVKLESPLPIRPLQ